MNKKNKRLITGMCIWLIPASLHFIGIDLPPALEIICMIIAMGGLAIAFSSILIKE